MEHHGALAHALEQIRAAVGSAVFPLSTSGGVQAAATAAVLAAELDDYLLPRLSRLDGPLLCVVGGSTGAGKSTLINSLVRAPVSPAGVIRPTTRGPLLVCHPQDTPAFAERALLPRLARASRPGERTLPVIGAPQLSPGLAVLDAPDIDSVVAANRSMARELFAAGDLWLFLTTAARYADAVPWRVLQDARDRGTTVAIVLDRVPLQARDEITADFAQMLAAVGMGDAPLFVVVESTLDRHGLLPEIDVAPIKKWLDSVARSRQRRREVTRRTLFGAITSVGPRVDELARAADDQVAAASVLAGQIRSAFATAMSEVESRIRGGAMLHGPVYAGWQDLVGSDDLRKALRSVRGPRRARVGAAVADRPPPGRGFLAEVAAAVVNLITEADVTAAQECRRRWRADGTGRALLAADPNLGRPWAGFGDAAHDLVHSWQTWLRALAGEEQRDVAPRTRSYPTAATVLLATIAAVAPPPGEITANELASTMLHAVLSHDLTASLGERARGELLVRIGDLLSAEVRRHLAPIAAAETDPALGHRLRAAAASLNSVQPAALGDAA